jgi:hypothetical protein
LEGLLQSWGELAGGLSTPAWGGRMAPIWIHNSNARICDGGAATHIQQPQFPTLEPDRRTFDEERRFAFWDLMSTTAAGH